MECIICYKRIIKDYELCYQCKQHYKRFPHYIRERILDYYRKLYVEGGIENEIKLE